MKTCPYCETENQPDATKCINCTADLTLEQPKIEEVAADDVPGSAEEAAAPEVELAETLVSSFDQDDIAAEELASPEPEAALEDAPAEMPPPAESFEDEALAATVVAGASVAAEETSKQGDDFLDWVKEEPEGDDFAPDAGAEIYEMPEAAPEAESPFERAARMTTPPAQQLEPGADAETPFVPMSSPKSDKDRSIALGLEILPGLIGFLGFGWMYADNLLVGLLLLGGYIVWNVIAVILDVVTVGIFLCVHLPVHAIVVALSAFILYRHTKNHPEMFGE